MTPIASQDLGFGITCIDTAYERPGLAACYLVEHQGAAAFIDTGTHYSVPLLLETLDRKGLSPSMVEYVIPTHVHLDHAGGAGELIRHCPNARLIIHPRGAQHMINPARLKAGAMAVYGEAAFKEQLGDLIAVPEDLVIKAPDETRVELNGRELIFLDTPGHAAHHFCIHDPMSEGIFSGDTFGVAYPELASAQGPYIFPPTTPVQFDPDAWLTTIDRLLALKPKRMYLTHYGMVSDIETLASQLKQRIRDFARLAKSLGAADTPTALEAHLKQQVTDEIQAAGNTLSREQIGELVHMDMNLNAQGLNVWLNRLEA